MREFYIAGVQFHESVKVASKLKIGNQLEMRAESTNKYDPNAVALFYNNNQAEDDCMIGYVPAKISAEISAMLIVSDNVTCTLTEVSLDNKPWERYKVLIAEEFEGGDFGVNDEGPEDGGEIY